MHLIKKQPKLRRPSTNFLKQPKRSRSLGSILKFSSILFTVAGGMLLALNIETSRYGFLLLAGSSGQLLLSSLLCRDRGLIAYSLSLFLCVDCLGVWRWVLN